MHSPQLSLLGIVGNVILAHVHGLLWTVIAMILTYGWYVVMIIATFGVWQSTGKPLGFVITIVVFYLLLFKFGNRERLIRTESQKQQT